MKNVQLYFFKLKYFLCIFLQNVWFAFKTIANHFFISVMIDIFLSELNYFLTRKINLESVFVINIILHFLMRNLFLSFGFFLNVISNTSKRQYCKFYC